MQFFKIHGELIKSENGCEENDRRAKRELSYRIQTKTSEFNGVSNKEFCFISEIDEDFVTFGLIATHSIDLVAFAGKFSKFVGINAKLSYPEEITFGSMGNLLGSANRQSYIEDDDDILERFGLDRLNRHRGLVFGENLINPKSKKDDLFKAAKNYYMDETMIPELERIYSIDKKTCATGHPVHYIVETDDRDTRREIYKILLDALYSNHRLGNCRYSFLDFRPGENYSQMAYEALYKVSDGGAVVVRYLANDDSDESSDASGERETIINICDMAKRYRNKVLTIFCFPRECKKIKAQFYENLGTMSFIEVREDFIDGKEAKSFLSSLAKKNHVRIDKKLFSDITEDRSYLAPELVSIFDEWYNVKLKTTVYPQYKDIAVARKETVKAKPQGTAYEELSIMIGLTEAKDVIKKALNYYKMQKLYDEKGVKKNNPAMHMIFTGNPGTAKTTVARLFARIMKENGLLSKGQLVEVGRGDLVGKYTVYTFVFQRSGQIFQIFPVLRNGIRIVEYDIFPPGFAYHVIEGFSGDILPFRRRNPADLRYTRQIFRSAVCGMIIAGDDLHIFTGILCKQSLNSGFHIKNVIMGTHQHRNHAFSSRQLATASSMEG